MRRILPLSVISPLMITGLLMAATPAMAQTANDPTATDPALEADIAAEGTDETLPEEVEGTFSRAIPEGQKANLSEEEIADYQAQLDAATTPQERNAVRKELQRTNQERHLEKVQATKNEKQKGFFESLTADFNDVVSGKAAKDSKARSKSDGDKNKASGGKERGGKERGGKDRSDRGK